MASKVVMKDLSLLTFSKPEISQQILGLAIKQPEVCKQVKSSNFLCIYRINQIKRDSMVYNTYCQRSSFTEVQNLQTFSGLEFQSQV